MKAPDAARAAPTSAADCDLPDLPSPMYIGALVRHTGASAKAIRLYESLGLLGRVSRLGAYRVYDARHVRQVRLIRQAQDLGLRLADVKAALGRGGSVEPDWGAVAAQVERQRTQVADEIARLQALQRNLAALALELTQCGDAVEDGKTAA